MQPTMLGSGIPALSLALFGGFGLSALVACLCCALAQAQARHAPPGMFKDLDDGIVGDALVIHGKQLFIDDYVIGELRGAKKVLNQPVKHPRNPLIVRDRPSDGYQIDYAAVVFDPEDRRFRLWYNATLGNPKAPDSTKLVVGYAISTDGITWRKPVTDRKTGTNHILFDPPEPFIGAPGVIIDPVDKDPKRRFKMLYIAKPTGKPSSLSTCAAYSADGIHWKQEPQNPLIPFSDTQISVYWDARLRMYVAYLRFGPPNIREVSRIESEDFVHWSPKVTVLKKTKMDAPFATDFYTLAATPYVGTYIGLLNTYHGETIQPIPADKPWMDRVNAQLVFSRNGVTWHRVAKEGALSTEDLRGDRDWSQVAEGATFLPNGKSKTDWDWGSIYPSQPPLVVGDEIRFYYAGLKGRHWATYHNDPLESGIGLATLRLDGFVSVEAKEVGTLTTKPLVFIGDTLVVNAAAAGGSLVVEVLDSAGRAIDGFASADCAPITTDSVRHVVTWRGDPDCHLLQARPVKLRFHLKHAKLYSFEPRIRHNHYLQSYD